MNTASDNSSEKSLEKEAEKKPPSTFSVGFSQILNDEEREFFRKRARATNPVKAKVREGQSAVSKAIFNWRNAIAVAAILTVGILHFAYQLSFIQLENSQNKAAAEAPPTAAPPAAPASEPKPEKFEAKKIDVDLPPKTELPVRQRPVETPPVKPPAKKKDAADARAERLRRAEKILTGI